jgi:hypothetical protein
MSPIACGLVAHGAHPVQRDYRRVSQLHSSSTSAQRLRELPARVSVKRSLVHVEVSAEAKRATRSSNRSTTRATKAALSSVMMKASGFGDREVGHGHITPG